MIDNSPNCYAFQPENSLPIISWYSDIADTYLYQLLPILQKLKDVDDVRDYLILMVSEKKVKSKNGVEK